MKRLILLTLIILMTGQADGQEKKDKTYSFWIDGREFIIEYEFVGDLKKGYFKDEKDLYQRLEQDSSFLFVERCKYQPFLPKEPDPDIRGITLPDLIIKTRMTLKPDWMKAVLKSFSPESLERIKNGILSNDSSKMCYPFLHLGFLYDQNGKIYALSFNAFYWQIIWQPFATAEEVAEFTLRIREYIMFKDEFTEGWERPERYLLTISKKFDFKAVADWLKNNHTDLNPIIR